MKITLAHKYRYQVVAEQIRTECDCGRYAKGVLPHGKDLASHFGVSLPTIASALDILVQEGILRRIKGKGTFIIGAGQGVSISSLVGFVMINEGHFYDPLYKTVMECLMNAGLLPVCYRFTPSNHASDKVSEARRTLQKLLCSPIRGLIVDGMAYWEFPFLNAYPDVKAVFINTFDAPGMIPGIGVLGDYEKGMYLATSHLLSLGHKKVVHLTIRPKQFPIRDEVYRRRHWVVQCEEGYRRALREAGLEQEGEILAMTGHDHWSEWQDILRGVMSRQKRPTAFVCSSDYSAVHAMKAAMDLGLRVPEDIALVGMYNTPWCVESAVTLTSVSMEEQEIARRAVSVVVSGKCSGRTILVEPKLIIRESCGGKAEKEKKNSVTV